MQTYYAATYFLKTASTWHPTEGASPDATTIVREYIHCRHATLAGLLAKLRSDFFIYGDGEQELFTPDEDGEVGQITYCQVETECGIEPNEEETKRWERGELELYVCDLHFTIEKQTIGPVTLDDFDREGIKH